MPNHYEEADLEESYALLSISEYETLLEVAQKQIKNNEISNDSDLLGYLNLLKVDIARLFKDHKNDSANLDFYLSSESIFFKYDLEEDSVKGYTTVYAYEDSSDKLYGLLIEYSTLTDDENVVVNADDISDIQLITFTKK